MPFIEQARRKIIDEHGIDASRLPNGVQVGDICYVYYKQMVNAWESNPRWATAHGIYSQVLRDNSHIIDIPLNLDHRAAWNLAWQVFFNLHVMPYELEKQKLNGPIGGCMPAMTAHTLTDAPIDKPKFLYLAGPMRGIPHFNFPAFHDAAGKLRSLGYVVFNPAENDNEHYGKDIGRDNTSGSEAQAEAEHGFSIRKAMHADLAFICEMANAVVTLPGHEQSRGARAEVATALAINIPVYSLTEVLSWGKR